MGHHIPLYPAKGYTLTATIKDPDRAPRIGGIDERSLVAWSRFGGELRMSATRATSCSPAPSTGTPRATARGFGRHDNLYYNTGHGHVGWTMACGSARMLADLIDERRPDIDPTPYSPINRNRHR